MALPLAMAIGCTQGTAGGPGVDDKSVEKPTYGQAENTFNLSVPVMSSSLQQGVATDVTVGIKRAENFDQDVTLVFADLPKGVTVEPASAVIGHGDEDAKIVFKVGDETAVGDYVVKVTGQPKSGADAVVDMKFSVSAKDSFTISLPYLSTSLKQGETKEFVVGISRDKTFDEDVTLKFSEMPKGVTIDNEAPVIKRGESEAKLMLTGSEDAALGNFSIDVTGHPVTGADSVKQFKLSVVKP
ncbi:hypothetical protein Psta_1693 [Pirellula staleyi DSM 6068]|uniref:Uncharacterized protein n=1 Tax=Pirellula staleyi (strain ATCC 27377 / DSM 6068 / ICPB 4128) TaxID=530564 RepID=D2QYR3_PIRSD|nr:hypothetical protein Psta_1693 [Pirellula staleyi DSM 6068]